MIKTFLSLVENQWVYGGEKYGLYSSSVKESTDCLFDTFGANWLYGTCAKYCYRFKNLARERDLLKIATYQFLIWLKRGFHVIDSGIDSPPINTNIKIKTENFTLFSAEILKEVSKFDYLDYTIGQLETEVTKHIDSEAKFKVTDKTVMAFTDDELLELISKILSGFAVTEWKNIKKIDLQEVFILCFKLWNRKFSTTPGSDADVWNEKNNGK